MQKIKGVAGEWGGTLFKGFDVQQTPAAILRAVGENRKEKVMGRSLPPIIATKKEKTGAEDGGGFAE